eukprot:3931397-Pleurochrysis_carterae.AAC.1
MSFEHHDFSAVGISSYGTYDSVSTNGGRTARAGISCICYDPGAQMHEELYCARSSSAVLSSSSRLSARG